MTASFIDRFSLWTDEQHRRADEIGRIVESGTLKLFRIAWPDSHGIVRAKTLTAPAFLAALRGGFNINVAAAMLDGAGTRVFSSFVEGGGVGIAEMTGSPNLVYVPDPTTFRVLPWAPEIGWILGDEYFTSGAPFVFSVRHLLRRCLRRLEARRLKSMIGLEVEFHLLQRAEEGLAPERIGAAGVRARAVQAFPVEPGFSLHCETNLDVMQPQIGALADTCEKLGLGLRSIEKEWGAGQLECTFAPCDALRAADNYALFRTAARQVARRMGFVASFMCRPATPGSYPSGWHLHQSLVEADDGRNLFAAETPGAPLSSLGLHYLGGLMARAAEGAVFTNPTVNSYRRFRANSLAPDRISWGLDHRGTMLRVLGGDDAKAARIENRVGEPAANPYLYIASQIVAGLDGIERRLDPGLPESDPYNAPHALLPKDLAQALDALERGHFFDDAFGSHFLDYHLRMKRSELGRFDDYQARHPAEDDEVSAWEQNEYFDVF